MVDWATSELTQVPSLATSTTAPMTTQHAAFGPTWTRTYLQAIYQRIAAKDPASVVAMIAATEVAFASAASATKWAIDKGEIFLGECDERLSTIESLREDIIDHIWTSYLVKTRSAHRQRARVVPGRVVMSDGVANEANRTEVFQALARHLGADWGDWPKKDKKKNDSALARGGSVFSRYALSNGDSLFILTEHALTKMCVSSDP